MLIKKTKYWINSIKLFEKYKTTIKFIITKKTIFFNEFILNKLIIIIEIKLSTKKLIIFSKKNVT